MNPSVGTPRYVLNFTSSLSSGNRFESFECLRRASNEEYLQILVEILQVAYVEVYQIADTAQDSFEQMLCLRPMFWCAIPEIEVPQDEHGNDVEGNETVQPLVRRAGSLNSSLEHDRYDEGAVCRDCGRPSQHRAARLESELLYHADHSKCRPVQQPRAREHDQEKQQVYLIQKSV